MKRVPALFCILAALCASVSAAPLPSFHRVDLDHAVAQIYSEAFIKHIPVEVAILIYADHVEFVSGVKEGAEFRWQAGIIAIAHTHPDRGYEKPSLRDAQTAKEHGIPVLVISRKQIWQVNPDGVMLLVLDKKDGRLLL